MNNLIIVKRELTDMLSQIPNDWDSHKRLEFVKVAIRSIIAGLVGRNRKELKYEIDELESTPNEMHCLKSTACGLLVGCEETRNKLPYILISV